MSTEISSSGDTASTNYRTIIGFSKRFSSPPNLVVGFNFLDFKNTQNLHIHSIVEGVFSPARPTGVSWLAFPKHNIELQSGSFTTKAARGDTKIVFFKHPYPGKPPKVVVFLTGLKVQHNVRCRVHAFASDVTAKGFTLSVISWGDTKLDEVVVSWVSIPDGKQGITAGRFDATDVKLWTKPLGKVQGVVEFDNTVNFVKTPKVFMALSLVDIDVMGQWRVDLRQNNANEKGLEWEIRTWGDSKLFGAGASYNYCFLELVSNHLLAIQLSLNAQGGSEIIQAVKRE
ncbi:hypothetical protein QBC38DRAFT_461317 [Podospora fimiseda]|uniref:H-type lectin domain-containing protein n=1 Tax=Podospora fimiseda TaxID=252190 RepID=A0AAN6YRR8_9PEZI|nr:hypothetical protein QBC38DRAFT_461317 [Podospora fimiseda]